MPTRETTSINLPALRRGRRRTRPLERCEVINMTVMSILLMVLIITSMFILNNSDGYNKGEPSLVLWLSSFQTVYLICILPFCSKSKKLFIASVIPYFTCVILSTNSFISNNVIPFETKFSIYHFVYLLANYGLIVLACNTTLYYNCVLPNRGVNNRNPFTEERDLIINYNIIPTSTKMITVEAVNQMCSICMEPITSQEVNIKTKCNHTFHKKCIDEWFSFGKNECPNCRQELVTEV